MAGGRRYGLRPTPQPPAIRVQGVGHFYFGGKHTKWVRFKSALTALSSEPQKLEGTR